jgi:hypothetical protein
VAPRVGAALDSFVDKYCLTFFFASTLLRSSKEIKMFC